jgi:CcmD family protein
MSSRAAGTLILFAILALIPQRASANEADFDLSLAAVAVQGPQAEPTAAVQQPSGLPQRAPDPRTLEEFWPIFAAFVLTWIAIVGYMLTFGRRVSRIADELGEIAGPRKE